MTLTTAQSTRPGGTSEPDPGGSALVSRDKQELKAALLSVYYHTLGRQFELRGAPTVLLPPLVRPKPLESALDIVLAQAVAARQSGVPESEDKTGPVNRVQEVLWTMLRSTPPPPLSNRKQTLHLRYPAPLRTFAHKVDFDLEEYDSRRQKYRVQSGLFAAALTAYASREYQAFEVLKDAYGNTPDFTQAVLYHRVLGGASPQDYLADIAPQKRRKKIAGELARLQDDVGVSLHALVNDLADCMAFLDILDALKRTKPDSLVHDGGTTEHSYRIYPTSALVVQDSQNLTTTVTVTTLVHAESLDLIKQTLDPQNWSKFSDAFKEIDYVQPVATGFTKLAESHVPGEWCGKDTSGKEGDKELLLREVVEVPSGLTTKVIARFENILHITLHERKLAGGSGTAELTYRLFRCRNSRYLWDERPGGILLDQGYIKVRPLGNVWRVTVRKILRFADRTPASWADTPLQFGQSLNYLAPAALSWWLQSDMYNAERYTLRERQELGRSSVDGSER